MGIVNAPCGVVMKKPTNGEHCTVLQITFALAARWERVYLHGSSLPWMVRILQYVLQNHVDSIYHFPDGQVTFLASQLAIVYKKA